MSPSLIFKAGALALACASTASANYVILDHFSGPTFFDNFYFNATLDPNFGFVEYIGAGNALLDSLAYYDTATDTAIMRVDDTNTYTPGVDTGRPSVRAQTLKTYQYGLFILDLAHMPGGACGSWPSFWTTSMNHWPDQGEIDIIENVNLASFSEETIHAGPAFPGDVCEVVGNVNTSPGQQTGTQTTYNCIWNATTSDYGTKTQYSGQGCSANNNNPNNFGDGFNLAQGGVYAMEWTDEVIQIWSWENGAAPADIADGTPDPLTWGKPIFTTWGGNCDIARHFIDHTLVLETNFCGDWGNAVWETSSCYDPVEYPTCSHYVGANPGDYSETYWAVRSLKIYQWSKSVVSTSTTATTTSATSTSSAAATSTAPTTTVPTAPSTPTAPATPLATVGDWVEIGCYTEATASRALTLGTKVNYSTMDLETCSAFCYTLGALYFGVEYGGECYCGNVLEAGSIPATDGCVMHCAGNPAETCGGSDHLNLFTYAPYVAPPTTSSSSTVAASSSTSSTDSYSASNTDSSSQPTSTDSYSASSTDLSSPTTSTNSYGTSSTDSYSASHTDSSYPISTSSGYSASTTDSYAASSSSTDSYPITSTFSGYSTSESSLFHSKSYMTETITTTTVRTVTSCAKTVTNCPASESTHTYVVTDTIERTTTYCPGNPTPTSSPVYTTSAPAYTTLTVYTTTVYTITSCAPTVTNCPAKLGAVTTETIIDYTTVCPVSEAISKGLTAYPTASSESTTTTYLTVVKMITETVKPVQYTPTKYTPTANSTVAGTTALTYSSSPSSSSFSFKGAASGLQAGSSLAMIVAAAALLL